MRGPLGRGVLCAWLCGLAGVLAAADPVKTTELLPPQLEVVRTENNVPIHLTYFPSRNGKETAVIILLHMKDSNRFVWQNGFAERLQGEGYAVVTVDLRGHGESKAGGAGVGPIAGGNANQPDDKRKAATPKKSTQAGPAMKPADYQAMIEDLNAVKGFLLKEHQALRLNISKLGLVGPEMGATVASVFAANDWLRPPYPDGVDLGRTPRGQDVKAIVLLSPQTAFEGMNTAAALHALRNPEWKVAFLICVGKNDPHDKGQATKLFQTVKALPKNETRMYFYSYAAKLRGTDLLGKGLKLEDHMVAFFNKHLRNLDSPWQDRRPRWDREKKP